MVDVVTFDLIRGLNAFPNTAFVQCTLSQHRNNIYIFFQNIQREKSNGKQ